MRNMRVVTHTEQMMETIMREQHAANSKCTTRSALVPPVLFDLFAYSLFSNDAERQLPDDVT